MRNIIISMMFSILLLASCTEKENTDRERPNLLNDAVLINGLEDSYWSSLLYIDTSNYVCIKDTQGQICRIIGVLKNSCISIMTDSVGLPLSIQLPQSDIKIHYVEDTIYCYFVTNHQILSDTLVIPSKTRKGIEDQFLNIIGYIANQLVDPDPMGMLRDLVDYLRVTDGMTPTEWANWALNEYDKNKIKEFLQNRETQAIEEDEKPLLVVGIKTGGYQMLSSSSVKCRMEGYLRIKDNLMNFTYGVCYSEHNLTTINDMVVEQTICNTLTCDITMSMPISFQITDLEEGNKYYYRVFFKDNNTGYLAYGEEKSFIMGEETTTNLFSVSSTKQVRFAPGNLANGGRSFTEHQYDYGGYFGWGTGNNPNNTSTDDYDYSQFYDWGDYIEGNWRSLNYGEWCYVVFREGKGGDATVCGVHGMVLLPDNWSGGNFNATINGNWDNNVYNAEQWENMESLGAVFLPAAGLRDGNALLYVGSAGFYWADGSTDWDMDFIGIPDGTGGDLDDVHLGKSVRLVEDVE